MKKITPHLWFDKEAKEAAEFYCSIFLNSKIINTTTLHDTPSGNCDVVSFELSGQPFMAISAGPLFKFNPSVSFFVTCETETEVDTLWQKFSEGGSTLMELGKYEWSAKYGWLADKYGLSWQIALGKIADVGQKITPSLLFVGKQHGKAEEAVNFYTSVFPNSQIDGILRHGAHEAPEKEGTVKHAQYTLDGGKFMAMDSGLEHRFAFNEAISFLVHCDTQEMIDYYWEKLSADPKAGQCGWLKDQYGLSWQVTPTLMEEMMKEKDETKLARVTEAFLKMKKFNIEELEKAYKGKK